MDSSPVLSSKITTLHVYTVYSTYSMIKTWIEQKVSFDNVLLWRTLFCEPLAVWSNPNNLLEKIKIKSMHLIREHTRTFQVFGDMLRNSE